MSISSAFLLLLVLCCVWQGAGIGQAGGRRVRGLPADVAHVWMRHSNPRRTGDRPAAKLKRQR